MTKRGRKPLYDLSQISCPNSACPGFRKSGGSRIVANGTYPTRGGAGQRYLCQTCGRSFCRQSGTIFEGLHTPEDKVISTLKLLAKGITLRKAAEIMEKKPDTLKQWLFRMAGRSEAVNQRLLRELGVSRSELDALWQTVRQNELRRRAVLWRKKCGWRQNWNNR